MSEEYEVETILKAKVFKRGKKMGWKYFVKWKGYGADDNTWEPPHSFSGSADEILDKFWERVDLGGRDKEDVKLFENGEEILPRGPPRRGRPSLGKDKASSSRSVPAASTPKASEPAVPADAKKARGKRGRPSTLEEPEISAKRTRGSSTKKKEPPPEPIPSPSPAPNSTDDELQLVGSGTASRPLRSPIKNPIKSPKRPARARKNGVPGRRARPTSEDVEMVDVVPDSTEELFGPGHDSADDEDVEKMVATDSPASGRLPALDLTSKSRVPARPTRKTPAKRNAGLQGEKPSGVATSSKTSTLEHPAPVDVEDDSTGAEASGSNGPSFSRRVSGSRAGPLSKGLKQRNASLLVGSKGGLTTLKRKNHKEEAQDALEVAEHLASEGSRIDSTAFEAPAGANGGATNVEITLNGGVEPPPSAPPPTAEQLLHLAGLKEAEAEALPDFEEDPPVQPSAAGQESASAAPELPAVMPTSVKFPAISSGGASKAWGSTIFGPLSLGFGTPAFAAQASGPEQATSQNTPPYLFSLDPSVSLPVTLKDICPATTLHSPHLSKILVPGLKGPPGALYKGAAALAVLDALETGGSAARLALHETADDQSTKVFTSFCEHLGDGGLFIIMAGAEIFASCAATNAAFVEKLGVPAQLRGLVDMVIISYVRVANGAAYANAAEQAERVRW